MPDQPPVLPGPVGVAQWVALEIMTLDPERRREAVAKIGDFFAMLAEGRGSTHVEAAVFALRMRQDIWDAMRAIEVSGAGSRQPSVKVREFA